MEIKRFEAAGIFTRVQVYQGEDGHSKACLMINPDTSTGMGESCVHDGFDNRIQMMTILDAIIHELADIRRDLDYADIYSESPWATLPKGGADGG